MTILPEALYRAAQVREMDRIAIEEQGVAGAVLMARAGAAAYAVLRQRWPQARRIAVLCGSGNNGGDGFVLARLAHQAGLQVQVMQFGGGARSGGAPAARTEMLEAGVEIKAFAAHLLGDSDVIVDALLGTGLNREVEGVWRAAIKAINACAAPVLALDIPSGLNADTGQVLGAAVKARATLSFIALKQGLFTGEAPDYCGTILFDDLDVGKELAARAVPGARRISLDILPGLAPRSRTAHKGNNGQVLVIGGDYGMAGAALLAAEAAARVGAGLVTVATRPVHALSLIGLRPELLWRGVDNADQLLPLLSAARVVAIGPGLGQSAWSSELLAAVLDSALPLVVDADALNLLARELYPARENRVLTPHPGEAARLLGWTAARIQADRFSAIAALRARYGGVIVLKGAGSLVAAGCAPPAVCVAGNPGMASGGMGDLLTGVIAGLIAQGLDIEAATQLGVCLHAAAGDLAAEEGERGLLAGDLLPCLRRLVNSP